MSITYLETLNIEWGQIYPKVNRRVNLFAEIFHVSGVSASQGPITDSWGYYYFYYSKFENSKIPGLTHAHIAHFFQRI